MMNLGPSAEGFAVLLYAKCKLMSDLKLIVFVHLVDAEPEVVVDDPSSGAVCLTSSLQSRRRLEHLPDSLPDVIDFERCVDPHRVFADARVVRRAADEQLGMFHRQLIVFRSLGRDGLHLSSRPPVR